MGEYLEFILSSIQVVCNLKQILQTIILTDNIWYEVW